MSEEKTNIRHLTEGFDFLGLTVRAFKSNINKPGERGTKFEGYKLIIRPSLASIKKFRKKVKGIFHSFRGARTDVLISKRNPLIRGWGNNFRPFSSRKTFELLDSYLYQEMYEIWIKKTPKQRETLGC